MLALKSYRKERFGNLLKTIVLLAGIFFYDNNVEAQAPGTTCAGAPTISVGSCTGSQSFANTVDAAPLYSVSGCIGTAHKIGWYSFVAPGGQPITVTATTTNTNADLAIQVISSTGACAGLVQIGCANNNPSGSSQIESISLGILAAGTYYIKILNVGAIVALNANTCVNITPPNDDCSNASIISPSAPAAACAGTAGTTLGATQSYASVGACAVAGAANDDVWYTFTATATTHVITITPSASFNPVFEVYPISCPSNNTSIINCTASGSNGTIATTTLTGLTINAHYWVRVYDAAAGALGIPGTSTFSICIQTPPTNDDCSGAQVLTPNNNCIPITGNDNVATNSGIAPAPSCASGGNPDDDVWYYFLATGSSHEIIVTPSASYTPVVEVYDMGTTNTFTCPTILNSIYCYSTGGNTGVTLNTGFIGMTAGHYYYIRVYDFNTGYPSPSTFTICVLNQPPVNDNCPGTTLTGLNPLCNPGTNQQTGDVSTATQSLGSVCTGTGGYDVWYNFTTTATVGQTYVVTVTPSASFDAIFQVFSGTCGVTNVTCVNNAGVGGIETTTLTTLNPSTQYWIRVYNNGNTVPATTTFTVCVTTPPLNDNCTGAFTITPTNPCTSYGGGTSVTGATASGYAATCGGTPNDDVWYTFVATAVSHIITVSAGACVTFDPVVQVYSSSCGGTSIACANATGAGGTETISLNTLTIGQQYWIRVYDFNGNATCSNFNICITTPPVNDPCSGAISLSPGTSCVTTGGTVLSGTPSFPPDCGGIVTSDVWYSFIASNASETITVAGSAGFDAIIEVYSTTCGGTSLGCTNATGVGGTESAAFTTLTPGAQYWIRVYDASGSPTTYNFTICVIVPQASDCITAINLCSSTNVPETSGSGQGNVAEIAPAGTTVGNPSTNPVAGNSGCLLSGELNSVWIIINVATAGTLEFTFLDITQPCAYHDWIMYAYDCPDITLHTLAPVRCNWNGPCTGGTGMVSVLPGGGSWSNYEPPLAVSAGDQYVVCLTNFSSVTGFISVSFGGTATVSCSPLPIELTSFTGQAAGKQNLLLWTTATETNNNYFTIEKSADPVNFQPYKKIDAAGNSLHTIEYSAFDINPINGTTYYRLKQTDYSGIYTYSNIVSIENTLSEVTVNNVRPNPTSDNINFDFYSTQHGIVHIQLMDVFGRIVDDETQSVPEGASILSANMSTLSKGIYTLKVLFVQSDYFSVTKVVKQ